MSNTVYFKEIKILRETGLSKCHFDQNSVTQILHEIDFPQIENVKKATFSISGALNFGFYDIPQILWAEIYKNGEIQTLGVKSRKQFP